MYTVPNIPGVTVKVFKENRLLAPEPDGYLGRLYSGSMTVLAVVDPATDPVIGLVRDGQDHYTAQKELMNLPAMRYERFPPTPAQQFMKNLLVEHKTAPGSLAFGIKMVVKTAHDQPVNFVHYPENMLTLAQYLRDKSGAPTDRVHVWNVAVVSQDGEFFLTVQRKYDTTVHKDAKGKVSFPRLKGHRLLEVLLTKHVPECTPLTPDIKFVPPSAPTAGGLPYDHGIVEAWYHARNMGCVITRRGTARVHWTDAPLQGRRRFLLEGERVKISLLEEPPINPKNDLRALRKSKFELQARGVEIIA